MQESNPDGLLFLRKVPSIDFIRWQSTIVATLNEERRDGAQMEHIKATGESHICIPPSSLFICYAFLLLFLLDSGTALEPRTYSLFLFFQLQRRSIGYQDTKSGCNSSVVKELFTSLAWSGVSRLESQLYLQVTPTSEIRSLDSNEFLSKSLRHYIEESFLASLVLTKTSRNNPLFEVTVSPHGRRTL